MISPRARSASPPASIIASRPTPWWASRWPAAAPIGASRKGWAAARAMPSKPASTARPAPARPISPRPSPSPIIGCRPTASSSTTTSPPISTRRATAGGSRGGYRFATIYGGITPYAAIQAQSFHTPAYTETDAIANGFALTFNGRDATDTRSELGARFDRVLAVYSNAVLALRGRVAWAHDWVSDPTLLPVFQALPGASFIVNGATPAKNSALTSAGAELRLANGVALLAKFDGEFASHSSTYAGTGTLRYRW